MAKTWKKDSHFDTTPENLVKILTSEEFHMAQQDQDEAIKEAAFKEVSRSDDKLKFVIECVEYSRGITGIDKSKTEDSTVSYDWNLKNMSASWVYKSSYGDRVQASGTEKVSGSGSRATLSSVFNLSVKAPIIGGQIEKFIIKDAEKSRPKFESLVRDFIKK